MGISGISVWQLLIVLLIVALLFGTRKLRTLGEDLGGAVRSFQMASGDPKIADNTAAEGQDGPQESNAPRLGERKPGGPKAD